MASVQGKIALDRGDDTSWPPAVLTQLCAGAGDSREPGRCYDRVMHSGEVDWGGGTSWSWRNALNLCRGTRHADALIRCFEKEVEGGTNWGRATEICRQREADGKLSVTVAPDLARHVSDIRVGGRRDADGDGHVAADAGGDDCDDSDPRRFPGNAEIADTEGHDEDCDPTTIAGRGGDGDRDGDGFIDEAFYNVRPDGRRNTGRDCRDSDPSTNPHGKEVCNGIDDDCDGEVDEDLLARVFRDADRDRFGDPGNSARMCVHEIRSGWVLNGDDCNDKDPTVNPSTGGCR